MFTNSYDFNQDISGWNVSKVVYFVSILETLTLFCFQSMDVMSKNETLSHFKLFLYYIDCYVCWCQ